MIKKTESRGSPKDAKIHNLEYVSLPGQKQQRRGRHRHLTHEVLRQLEVLKADWALKILLLDVPAKTLRSAIFRAASAKGIKIASFSDPGHLYVLRKFPTGRRRGAEE